MVMMMMMKINGWHHGRHIGQAGQVVPPLSDLLTGHHSSSSASSNTFLIRGGPDRPQSLFYFVPQPSRIGWRGRTKAQQVFAIIWDLFSSADADADFISALSFVR